MINNSLFSDVPVEEGTTIIKQKVTAFGEFNALYQKWCWDGITGESLIFLTQEVQGLSDEELILKAHSEFDSKVTISRGVKFTFVNFHFEAPY